MWRWGSSVSQTRLRAPSRWETCSAQGCHKPSICKKKAQESEAQWNKEVSPVAPSVCSHRTCSPSAVLLASMCPSGPHGLPLLSHPWDLWTRKRACSSRSISFAGDLKQGFSLVLKYPNNPSTENETVNLSPGLFALLLSSASVLSQPILGQLAQNQKRTCVSMKYRREGKGARVFQTPFHQIWHQTLYTYFPLKTTKTLQGVY